MLSTTCLYVELYWYMYKATFVNADSKFCDFNNLLLSTGCYILQANGTVKAFQTQWKSKQSS